MTEWDGMASERDAMGTGAREQWEGREREAHKRRAKRERKNAINYKHFPLLQPTSPDGGRIPLQFPKVP